MMSVLLIAAVRMPHMVLASTSLAMEQESQPLMFIGSITSLLYTLAMVCCYGD